MKNKFNVDFNALCRLCLNKLPELSPIFDFNINFTYRIESCMGINVQQCDPGPSRVCINCLNHLENCEEFKQKCISSNEYIQEYLKQLEEDKLNLTVHTIVKLKDQLKINEHDNNYDSTFNNELDNQYFDNGLSKSKSSVSTINEDIYPKVINKNKKANDVNKTKTTKKKYHYECGMCFVGFTEKDSLYNHLTDIHNLEENNTPHYCMICNKGYSGFKIYQDHLTAEQDIHGITQIQDKDKNCTIGCGLCNYKFTRSTSLYRHLRNHALNKDLIPHLCSFCQVGFLDSYSLYLHASIEHNTVSDTESQPLKVDTSKNEESSNDLNKKELLIVNKNELNCKFKDNNNYTITTNRRIKKLKTLEDKRAKYREHYRRFQSKTYTCEFCDITYSRFCDLSNHDRTAHDDMPKEFSCPTCGKLFLTDSRLRIHQNAFHAEKTFTCDICKVLCKSKDTLRTHMRKHSGIFTCSYCNLTTASNAALVSHIRVHTGEKPFVCDECGNSYASKLGLTSHKHTHVQEALFKCNICGYTGSSHSSIYIHKQTHSTDKPFICDVCGKTFKIKVRLFDHQKIHFATKNYECEVCNKAFLARYQLVQHSRTHSGEKPFQCHLCVKAFARRDGLSEHIRTHTGEKRYTCLECLKTFSFYKSMKNHKCGGVKGDKNKNEKSIKTLPPPKLNTLLQDINEPSMSGETLHIDSYLKHKPSYVQQEPTETKNDIPVLTVDDVPNPLIIQTIKIE